ncbi:hypothetical protein [Streptomyces odontomachi]|uniref:hypothetical protein n=1 Tax=Streptomyces odontomachi TaxID=2944940 RepID=UPI0021096AF0|nr:hypothetical protein [Streptomyces sp. ODS25]
MLPDLPVHGAVASLVAAVAVLLVAWSAWRALRRLGGGGKRGTPAVWAASVAAAGCTAYSADTSWRFAADYLDMSGTAERAGMFGAAELALFATALMARQNLNGPARAPGAPGVLVWLITGVQIIPAYAESGAVGGTVRAFVGPVMAAMLWHLAMGIELRHRKPDAASRGVAAVVGRELRERMLSCLGIAASNRDAAQITRDRATVRAVALAAQLAEKTPEQRGRRSGRRAARRLAVAVARASVGTDREQRRTLLDQLAARRHAAALATVDLPSPWEEFTTDPAASALAANTREQMRHATDTIRRHGAPSRLLFADVVPAYGVNGGGCSPEHRTPVGSSAAEGPAAEKLDTAKAHAAIEDGWTQGLTIRETAKRATRAPSYVHGVFVRLEEERGPRPASDQPEMGDDADEPDAEAAEPAIPEPSAVATP